MNNKIQFLVPLIFLVAIINGFSQDTVSYYWELNSLKQIGGNTLSYTGSPKIEDTDIGKAMRFDATNSERILINANPIGDAKEFTVEVVFKADPGNENQTNEPRFVHIQDPNDPDQKRVMMEIRVNGNDELYLDGFMNTDNDNLTLVDANKTHAVENWIHAAITYKDNTLKTYINGVEELSGTVSYASQFINSTGKTSLGARMNEKNYYSGLIKCLKVSHAKLNPSQFINIDTMNIDSTSGTGTFIISTQQSDKIQIYPMSAANFFNVKFPGRTYVSTIELINISGVHEKQLTLMRECRELIEINVADLNSGIYFLKVNTNLGCFVKQMLISR